MELRRDFYVGTVEDNKDPNRKGRIKVRVQTLYHNIAIEDMPYAYPFAGLAGKEFQVPAIGKLVNILFLSDDLYSPYYIYSENYNTNLQSKLKDLSEEEYVNFVALLFDERTNIFADSGELTIDHLYNKITINNTSINHELKDNNQMLNLGSKDSEQEAVLGTRFFDWMDRFVKELLNPFSLVGNMGAPVLKPKLQALCQEYQATQAKKKNFLSDNVRIVDNGSVKKLERTPSTVFRKDDVDLILSMLDEKDQCQDYKEQESKEKEILQKAVKAQNKKACKQGKSAKPTDYVNPGSDMSLPLVGNRISSRFGLRQNPTDPSKPQGHSGTDIAAPIGTPVYSPEDGKVISAGWDDAYGGGNVIRIKHINDFTTGYAHLSKILVEKRQNVKKGDIIGLVGNTGGHTTGSHLHFTVTTPESVRVDPELYFKWPDSNTQLAENKEYKGQEYKENSNDCSSSGDAIAPESQQDPDIESSPLATEFSDESFSKVTEKVINKLEGGYYHPDMMEDGRLKKDKRYKTSGETMFGIDRKNFAKKSSPAFKEFWKIIDDANARENWKWNYRGGKDEARLTQLAAEMIKPLYDDYTNKYLSDQALEIVNGDEKLMFNFTYATWNGEGWFQRFAQKINDAVNQGITDVKTLRKIALDARKNSGNSLIAQSGNAIENFIT